MSTSTMVPLVDLGAQHARIADSVRQAMDDVINSSTFILGPQVTRFEREFAEYCQVDDVIGVGNGTDALELALRAYGVGRNDEVILPANTFVATAEAVIRCGASPVLVDCDDFFLIDPDLVSERLTARTRAVIPVHLFGQTAQVELIRDVVGPELPIIEDAAQAQGAERFGRRAGSLGNAASTSFYPGKNLGAYGDAGAVMTSVPDIAETVRAMRNHGGVRKYEHGMFGVNSRLDSLQAAVLSVKLEVLDKWNEERREAADMYSELLADSDSITVPEVVEGNSHVWHLYVVRVPGRDRVVADLNALGIGAGIHYPAPLHLLPAFGFLGLGPGDYPVAERAADEILSLPIYPGITKEQQLLVAATLQRAVKGR